MLGEMLTCYVQTGIIASFAVIASTIGRDMCVLEGWM
jgi:hypothetical protein